MKRGLVFTLCAMALAASASVGRAQTIDLSLNLRYTNPAKPELGGLWYLVAKTSGGSPNAGIAGVSAYITNISTTVSHGSSIAAGNGYPAVTASTINNIAGTGGNPFNGIFNGATNVLYGQDISVGALNPIIGGIGQGSGAGNVASDPLKNSAFNNYAVLLSGTFAGGGNAGNQFNRPAFSTAAGNVTSGNVLASTTLGTAAIAATVTTHVRGDNLNTFTFNTPGTAGLRAGDSNRDFAIGAADLVNVTNNWGPAAGNRTWDQGDSNGDGNIGAADLVNVTNNWSPAGYTPVPALAAVPEPTSLALGSLAVGLLLAARRRKA